MNKTIQISFFILLISSLFSCKSTKVIAKFAEHLKGEIPIIGVGGIDSVIAAKEKIEAGASLVQIYSGFIYQGPPLIKELVNA